MVIATGEEAEAADINDIIASIITHAALTTGAHGVTGGTVAIIKADTYSGNDTDDRQIATGFACKLVLVLRTDVATKFLWICLSTSIAIKLVEAGAIEEKADVLLHATDGFVVDQADANASGRTYVYVAFG